MNDTTRQSVLFKDLFTKPVVACFDQPDSSSDGGALFLKACDEPLGLTQSLARCLLDARHRFVRPGCRHRCASAHRPRH